MQMTPEQIKSSIEWYRRVGDGSISVFFTNGQHAVGRVSRVTDEGFNLAGHGRVQYSEVEAAESGCFA